MQLKLAVRILVLMKKDWEKPTVSFKGKKKEKKRKRKKKKCLYSIHLFFMTKTRLMSNITFGLHH